MTECLLCVVCGVLLCLLIKGELKVPTFKRKPAEKAREPTEAEMRQFKRAVKEYSNFMTYDGSTQDDITD